MCLEGRLFADDKHLVTREAKRLNRKLLIQWRMNRILLHVNCSCHFVMSSGKIKDISLNIF